MADPKNIGWKVFICHSSKDKATFVTPLAKLLRQKGIEIWYDEFSIARGDFIDENIHSGLKDSKGGIVVVSKEFIALKPNKRNWINEELYVLLHNKKVNDGFLIPIFYDISRNELPEEYKPLSNIQGFDFKKDDNLKQFANNISKELRKIQIREGFIPAKSYGFVSWNEAANDCKSLSIANATSTKGFRTPCWPLSFVKANEEEVINVRIYYHNTGIITASNTHIVLIPSTELNSISKSKKFIGRIISDQGSSTFGPVIVKFSSSQSLTFLSTKWYAKNKCEKLTPLINGQSGKEIMTDEGLAIGPIKNGWSSQGSVIVAFRGLNNTI